MFKRILIFPAVVIASLFVCVQAHAQEHDAPKAEIGGQFTTLKLRAPELFFPPSLTEPGVGVRVGYNVTDFFGVEAELNFLPRRGYFGRMKQAQFGMKAGKRWSKFGLFAKVRPGFVNFSEVPPPVFGIVVGANGRSSFPPMRSEERTVFSTDLGGVVEFYPARKLLLRFDVGDTLIRYRPKELRLNEFLTLRDMPTGFKHNLQVTTGVAYRFLNPRGADETQPPAPAARRSAPRFEAGVQYTTLILNPPPDLFVIRDVSVNPVVVSFPSTVKASLGGRLTFNLNDHLALEGAVDYLPGVDDEFFPSTSVGGDGVQGQFGLKAGRRFRRFGLFGKVRPGFVSFDNVRQLVGTRVVNFGSQTFTFGVYRPVRRTYFETDVGGVVEFYPTRRIVTRFDAGDTIIRYQGRIVEGFSSEIMPQPVQTKHNFQFSAGVGFRF